MRNFFCILSVSVILAGGFAAADTFVNSQTGQIYHGYATGNEEAGVSEVNTVEDGIVKLNLSQFKITRDRAGRNETVALLTVPEEIALGMETNAFETAIRDAASRGPLFILIEIDSPGGRVDLAIRMCTAITKTVNCDTYAYIKGGDDGGAYSAAAAAALACNKIYMAPGTVIGAATLISRDERGKPIDITQGFGETVGEKMSSAWRNYLASLAESNNRPTVLVRAMENKDIEAIEVYENGKRVFMDAADKRPDQEAVKIWSKKGSLLTLTVAEAADCGIADKMYNNRQDLLADHNALSAQIIADGSMAEARKLYERIEKSLKRISASMDLNMKRLDATRSRGQALKTMKGLMSDAQFVLGLKRKYGDDVPVDEEAVQSFLNSVKADYEALQAAGRQGR